MRILAYLVVYLFVSQGMIRAIQAENSMPRHSGYTSEAANMHNELWVNSLGMKFKRINGTDAMFCIWEIRIKDFREFIKDTNNNDGYKYDNDKGIFIIDEEGHWMNTKFFNKYNYGWDNPGFPQGEDSPVTCISWHDAKEFCKWLTKIEQDSELISKKQIYRLPFDWEWSKAVEIQMQNVNAIDSNSEIIEDIYPWNCGRGTWPPGIGDGNYGELLCIDKFKYTSPVGSLKVGANGLYDLGGNVWEWCEDIYDTSDHRVMRGGSWLNNYPKYMLSSYRYRAKFDERFVSYGFRVVLSNIFNNQIKPYSDKINGEKR